jgi:hypothetical protein
MELINLGSAQRRRANQILESKHARTGNRSITYQLELVLCGKIGCRALHGPYWYAYWKHEGRTRKCYVGRAFRKLSAAQARTAEFGTTLGNRRRLPKVAPRKRPK